MTKNPKIKGPLCHASVSNGVIVCVLAKGHAKEHSSSSQRGKVAQHATWELNPLSGKIAVKVFSHGKQTGDWEEDGPKDERKAAQPCGCSGVDDTHALGTPIVCSVQSHHACACRGTAFQLHLNDVKGCENPTTNPQHKRTWFTDANGLVARVEEEDDRPWLIKQTEQRDAAGRKPMTAEQKLRDPNSGGVLVEDLLAERDAKAKASAEPDELEEGDDPLEDEVRSDADRDLARQMREEREAHAAEIERAEPIVESDTKPGNMIGGYPIHPAAALFPLITGDEFTAFVEDMRTNKQRTCIVLLGGAILDGRNRLRALIHLGMEPKFREFGSEPTDGPDPIAFVVSENINGRRHLNETDRAYIGAELVPMYEAQAKERMIAGKKDPSANLREGQKASEAAAAAVNVSPRSIEHALKVKRDADPEVLAASRNEGRVAVSAAAELAKLPKDRQREHLANNKKITIGKARALVRQDQKREVVRRINSDLVKPMPTGPFGLIVVDYAWKFRNSDQHEGSRGHLPYPPMEWDEILRHAAEASKRAADDCVLGLWVVNAYLRKFGEVLDAWGFVDMEAPITWNKVHMGMGIRGPRHQTEHLILAEKGAPTHTLNEITTYFEEPRVIGSAGHSKKPDRLYDLLAKHCAGPRLELFAIGEREGWATWGAEADRPIATERKKKSKILTSTDERLRAS